MTLPEIRDTKFWSVIIIVIIAISSLALNRDYPLGDFANYYFGAASIPHSFNIYDSWEFNKFIVESGQARVYANFAPHPPITRYFFLPFLVFDPSIAKMIFGLIGALLFSFALFRFLQKLELGDYLPLLIPLVFIVPLSINIKYGQSYLWLLFFLVMTFLYSERKRSWWSAIFLTCAILIKFTPILFLIYFLLDRKYALIFKTSIIVAMVVGADIVLSGVNNWIVFFSDIIPRASVGLINSTFSVYHHSVNAFFKSLFIYDADYNPNTLINSESAYFLFSRCFAIVLIFATYLIHKKANRVYVFSLWIFVLYALPSIGSTYSTILLVIPFILMLQNAEGWKNLSGILIVALLSSVFVFFGTSETGLAIFTGMILLLFLHLYSALREDLSWAFVFSGLVSAFLISSFPSTKGDSVIDVFNTSIYGDLKIENGKILFEKFNAAGFMTEILEADKEANTIEELNIDEAKYQYNFGGGNVKAALLLDSDMIYFLSDARHGYGFYQLRKMQVK